MIKTSKVNKKRIKSTDDGNRVEKQEEGGSTIWQKQILGWTKLKRKGRERQTKNNKDDMSPKICTCSNNEKETISGPISWPSYYL
mmetsp:Transcript_39055/g.44515  ORF Transcript_39055/g.44515 Transcript_39055/m.44515 type:complete len:85 (-) Transcript_39055:717-971(-)